MPSLFPTPKLESLLMGQDEEEQDEEDEEEEDQVEEDQDEEEEDEEEQDEAETRKVKRGLRSSRKNLLLRKRRRMRK